MFVLELDKHKNVDIHEFRKRYWTIAHFTFNFKPKFLQRFMQSQKLKHN